MIVTLTPNPSVDRTVVLDGVLARGAVQRARSETTHPGGKGVNISRGTVAAGLATLAVLPARADDPLVLELRAAGIDCHPVQPAGDVRVNTALVEPDGTTTKVNSPGAPVGPETLAALEAALVEASDAFRADGDEPGSDWLVLAGSLPPGAPTDWYADLVARLRGHGRRVAVDTSDAPLAALVDRLPGAAPSVMKPNGSELASLTGEDPDLLERVPAAAAHAAETLVRRGVEAVLATLGPHGAVLVTAEGAWHATPPSTTVLSTVGAGDSSLLGYLLGDVRGLPPQERLRQAVAWGAAAAGLPGTTIPRPDQVHPDLVPVHVLDTVPGGTP